MEYLLSRISGWCQRAGATDNLELSVDIRSGAIRKVWDDPGEGQGAVYGPECLILPGDVNAHSHPEQSVYVDFVDPAWDLATWCRRTIYRHSVDMTPRLIYLGCCRAFAHMLLAGVTTVVVSFYCHNGRGNELDREVLRAARDTGIRLYFGRMHYDVVSAEAYPEKKASQESYYETQSEYEGYLDELMSEVEGDPFVTVAPCLHSFHANTLEAVAAGIRLGAERDRLVQFHLSEDRGDVDLCLARYGKRPVEVLDDLVRRGEVSGLDHLFVSDGIWTDEHEKDLMAEHGMNLVLNPRMNRRVKAGQADLEGYLKRGIPVYLGTDGEASNDDLSIENERRFLRECYPNLNPSVWPVVERGSFPFPAGTAGTLEPGAFADLKVLEQGKIRDVYVGGCKVVEGGRLITLDPERDIEIPLSELTVLWRE